MIEKNMTPLGDKNSETYKSLKAFFTKNKGTIKTTHELEDIISHILLELKFDNIPSTVFFILEEHNYVFKDDQTANIFLKIYLNLTNNSRKWTLKGFTPIEVNTLF